MASKTKTVLISHRDGREHEVTEYDFYNKKVDGDKTYEGLGFKVERWAGTPDGSFEAYEAPQAPAAALEPAAPDKGKAK